MWSSMSQYQTWLIRWKTNELLDLGFQFLNENILKGPQKMLVFEQVPFLEENAKYDEKMPYFQMGCKMYKMQKFYGLIAIVA